MAAKYAVMVKGSGSEQPDLFVYEEVELLDIIRQEIFDLATNHNSTPIANSSCESSLFCIDTDIDDIQYGELFDSANHPTDGNNSTQLAQDTINDFCAHSYFLNSSLEIRRVNIMAENILDRIKERKNCRIESIKFEHSSNCIPEFTSSFFQNAGIENTEDQEWIDKEFYEIRVIEE